MAEMPVIYPERCNGCGLCLGVCPNNAFALVGKVIAIVAVNNCDWCLECEAVCPTRAIAGPFEIVFEES